MKTFTIKGTLRVNVSQEDTLAVVKGDDMDALHAAATILFGEEYTGISIVSDDASPSFIFAPVDYSEDDAADTFDLFDESDDYPDDHSWEFYYDEGDPYAGTYSEM